MIDFVMEKVFMPFMAIFIFLFVCFCIAGVFCIPSCIEQDKRNKQQIKECFMQEIKTKECEYILWEYELKQKQPRNNTSVRSVPMVIRH